MLRAAVVAAGRLASASKHTPAAQTGVVMVRSLAPVVAFSTTPEETMAAKLRSALDASVAEVTDLSGGCGATYRVVIVSPQFEGLSLVKQHKLVKATLKEDIAEMHALTLKTYTPAKYEAERT